MTVRKMLVMVGNDVAGELVFDDRFPYNKKLYDALLGEFTIVTVNPEIEVQQGYVWDGLQYNVPTTI